MCFVCIPGGGTQVWVTCHVPPKRPTCIPFFARFHRKTPIFTNFHPMTPLFFENFDIFDEMLRNFWPFWSWKPLFFNAFHWKTPYFCALCQWKTPFFDVICHRKTPTSEVLGGMHSYVTFICECPLGCILYIFATLKTFSCPSKFWSWHH